MMFCWVLRWDLIQSSLSLSLLYSWARPSNYYPSTSASFELGFQECTKKNTCFYMILGFELRASCMLDNYSTNMPPLPWWYLCKHCVWWEISPIDSYIWTHDPQLVGLLRKFLKLQEVDTCQSKYIMVTEAVWVYSLIPLPVCLFWIYVDKNMTT